MKIFPSLITDPSFQFTPANETLALNATPLPFPSLMQQILTPEMRDDLSRLETSNGVTLDKIIASGVAHNDSKIGVYAGDEECYTTFSALMDPVIERYHQVSLPLTHTKQFSPMDLDLSFSPMAEQQIQSVRVRIARNLAGVPFESSLSNDQRADVEQRITNALQTLAPTLSGHYYSLNSLHPDSRASMIANHELFVTEDPHLDTAGIYDDLPNNRGTFISDDRSLIIWVNEEDHLRIMALAKGCDVQQVATKVKDASDYLNDQLDFAYSPELGYLTSCPTNLGTTMRASVHVALPNLAKHPRILDECLRDHGLQKRSIHGESYQATGYVFDISNAKRLGTTENCTGLIEPDALIRDNLANH